MASSVTKFFRKHNKKLIAIFGVGLMIVFLLPASITQLAKPDYTKRAIGEAFGKKIHIYDLVGVRAETALLDRLSGILAQANQQSRSPFQWRMFVPFSPTQDQEMDYYLLIQEAHRMGIVVSEDKAEEVLRESRIPGEIVNSIVKESGLPLSVLRKAIADFMSVANALDIVAADVKVSTPEQEEVFKLMSNRIKANLVPVSAEAFVKEVPAPTEAQLESYFAANLEKFRYPDRVQMEYLSADVDQVKNDIKVSDDSAKEYIKDNPDEFMKSVMPTTKPGEKPATQPVKVKMDDKEAMAMAIDKLKTKKARDLIQKAMNEAYVEIKRFWSQATVDAAGVLQKPAQIADYQKMADTLSKKFHVPVVYHRTPLMSIDDLRAMDGIGRSMVFENGKPLYFSDYAFRVVPFVQPPSAKEKHANDVRYLVGWQDSDLLRQMDRTGDIGGMYIFRVTEASKSHLPASAAEIKDKVAQEYKLAEAFKLAKPSVDKLVALAQKQKLDTVLGSKDKKAKSAKALLAQLNIKSVEPQTFSKRMFGYTGQLMPPMLTGVTGDTAKVADTAFEKLWNQPTTQPDGQFTTILVPDEASKNYYVLQYLEKEPATVDKFERIRPYLLQYLLRDKQQQFVQNWFKAENIHKRTGYVSMTPDEES
jgi:hypothetical protein